MPMRNTPEPATAHALEHHRDGFQVDLLTVRGLPLEAARNHLWQRCAALQPRPEMIVWADADAFWLHGTFAAAAQRLTALGPRVLLGSFHGKRKPFSRLQAYHVVNGQPRIISIAEAKAAPDGLTPAFFIGSHFLVHGPELLDALGDAPFTLDELTAGEDHIFCTRALRAGWSILLDARLPVFHVEAGSGYLPGRPRFIYRDGGMEMTNEPPPDHQEPRPSPPRSYGAQIDALRARLTRPDGSLRASPSKG